MMRPFLALAVLLMLHQSSEAVETMPSGRLALELHKLETLGSALYVAAHPDDENTKLITYLANEAQVHTTYLSLTRGDGGQNLLGLDLGDKLGLIRTQELLAARRIDGGEQRFSRANDFGYSKTPEETLRIWGKEETLADIVWIIRTTRPDVIITRFSMEAGFTHGHHTASTWLAKEAFAAAADPARFPEQLSHVEPWAAKRLVWNTSSWFYLRRNLDFDSAGLLGLDSGAYNPLLGTSYAEIAAQSRSSHKTQGFGATPELGESMEYFAHLAGEPTTEGLFAGVDTSWGRVTDSAPVATAIRNAIRAFSPRDPAQAVPHLIEAHRELTALPDQFWKARKLHDLERVIAACLGLDVESISEQRSAVPGSEVNLRFHAIQRSSHPVQIAFAPSFPDETAEPPTPLGPNQLVRLRRTVRLPEDLDVSQPYWLREPHGIGRYEVADPQRIGAPENGPALPVDVHLIVDGYRLRYLIPTTWNSNDPVDGEVKEPFIVTPPAMVNLPESPLIFGDATPRTVTARIRAGTDVANGQIRFAAESGWRVEPASAAFDARAGEEVRVEVTLIPPAQASRAMLRAELLIDGNTYHRGFERVAYDHIPEQTLFPKAEARVVLLDVKTAGERIGYIPGAGDAIPEALARIGYTVDTLGESDMTPEVLARYDAIVMGIRVLNTNDRIGLYMPHLFEYASGGGVVIQQYNTNGNLKTDNFSPYPFSLSRGRVTDETAEMRVLAPAHPVLNFPNPISGADFEHWVQERGLYFATGWDPAFTAILSANDAGEAPLDGSLLVARHGDGWFVYSGLSWFRQLPAGVPGAYRLFANLVSLGHAE